jgi:hypothetical protein
VALIHQHLEIGSLLETEVPPSVRAVCERVIGTIWSPAVLRSLEAELQALAADVMAAEQRLTDLRTALPRLAQQRDLLKAYARLLDALAARPAAQYRGSVDEGEIT